MDFSKGFKIVSDGTNAGTQIEDSEGNVVGGMSYFQLTLNADEYRPTIEMFFGPIEIDQEKDEE